jgi:hypothetical protein
MAAMEPTGVRAQQPMHPFAQIGVGRFDDQMKMVAQQAIRMHLPISLLTRLSQRFEEVLPIHARVSPRKLVFHFHFQRLSPLMVADTHRLCFSLRSLRPAFSAVTTGLVTWPSAPH